MAPSLVVYELTEQEEEEGDGSGSIKDFRTKMWRLAREEAEDAWVPYEWREGEVRPPSNTCARLPLTR